MVEFDLFVVISLGILVVVVVVVVVDVVVVDVFFLDRGFADIEVSALLSGDFVVVVDPSGFADTSSLSGDNKAKSSEIRTKD